jgi:non-ribosomal peptide synthetase component F
VGADAGAAEGVDMQDAGCSREVSDRLRAFCRDHRTTLYVLLLSALYALVHLHSRRPRLAVWGALANRPIDTEQSIGWFSEGRLFGTTVSAEMSFEELVESVRALVLNASANQDLPLAAIQHPGYRRPIHTLHGTRALHVTLQMAYRAESAVTLDDHTSLSVLRLPYNQTTAPNVVRIAVYPGP